MLYLPMLVFQSKSLQFYSPLFFKPPSNFPSVPDNTVLVEIILQTDFNAADSFYKFLPNVYDLSEESNMRSNYFSVYPEPERNFPPEIFTYSSKQPITIKKFGGRKQCFHCFLNHTFPYLGPLNAYNLGESEIVNASQYWVSIPFVDWRFRDVCEICKNPSVDNSIPLG